jgi:hypothetical protein
LKKLYEIIKINEAKLKEYLPILNLVTSIDVWVFLKHIRHAWIHLPYGEISIEDLAEKEDEEQKGPD